MVELRNYLVQPARKRVDVYYCVDGYWGKKKSEKIAVGNKEEVSSAFVTFGSGGNQDDVIVSHFTSGGNCTSEYYLFTT